MNLIKRLSKRFVVPLSMLVLIALQVTCESARADTELTSMMKAKTAAEVSAVGHRADELAVLGEECEAQLALKSIPRSCFRVLHLSESGKRESWLVSECIQSAKRSTSRRDLGDDSSDLPPTCRDAVSERLADLEYLDLSERPERLFRLVRTTRPDSGPHFER